MAPKAIIFDLGDTKILHNLQEKYTTISGQALGEHKVFENRKIETSRNGGHRTILKIRFIFFESLEYEIKIDPTTWNDLF